MPLGSLWKLPKHRLCIRRLWGLAVYFCSAVAGSQTSDKQFSLNKTLLPFGVLKAKWIAGSPSLMFTGPAMSIADKIGSMKSGLG